MKALLQILRVLEGGAGTLRAGLSRRVCTGPKASAIVAHCGLSSHLHAGSFDKAVEWKGTFFLGLQESWPFPFDKAFRGALGCLILYRLSLIATRAPC